MYRGFDFGIKIIEKVLLRDADPDAADLVSERALEVLGRNLRRTGVTRIVTSNGMQKDRGVAHRAGEGSRGVHAPAQGKDAVSADPAERGLQSDHPGQTRRDADRSTRVGAERGN